MTTMDDLDLFYGEVKLCSLGFAIGESEKMDFSETIGSSDLNVGRNRQLFFLIQFNVPFKII